MCKDLQVQDFRKQPLESLTPQVITGRIHLMQDNLRFLKLQQQDVEAAIEVLRGKLTELKGNKND